MDLITKPKVALGAWAWGMDGTFGDHYSVESLKPVFDTALKNGLVIISTKFTPQPLHCQLRRFPKWKTQQMS